MDRILDTPGHMMHIERQADEIKKTGGYKPSKQEAQALRVDDSVNFAKEIGTTVRVHNVDLQTGMAEVQFERARSKPVTRELAKQLGKNFKVSKAKKPETTEMVQVQPKRKGLKEMLGIGKKGVQQR